MKAIDKILELTLGNCFSIVTIVSVEEVLMISFVVHRGVFDGFFIFNVMFVMFGVVMLIQGVLVYVLNLTDMMIHLVVLVMRLFMYLFNPQIVVEVVERVLLVVLLNHVIPVIVMLGNWRRLLVDLGVMVHVRCCVVCGILRRVMAMFMVDDGLVMDAIVVMNQVLIKVVIVIYSILLMIFMIFMMIQEMTLFMVMLRLLVVVRYISNGGVVDLVILMEPMVHFLLFSVIEFL